MRAHRCTPLCTTVQVCPTNRTILTIAYLAFQNPTASDLDCMTTTPMANVPANLREDPPGTRGTPFTATSRPHDVANVLGPTPAPHYAPLPMQVHLAIHCAVHPPLLPTMNPTLPCNSNAKRPSLPMRPPPPTEQRKAAAPHALRSLPCCPNATIYPHPPSIVLSREPHWLHHYVCVLVKSMMNKTHSSSIDSVRRERSPLPPLLLQARPVVKIHRNGNIKKCLDIRGAQCENGAPVQGRSYHCLTRFPDQLQFRLQWDTGTAMDTRTGVGLYPYRPSLASLCGIVMAY